MCTYNINLTITRIYRDIVLSKIQNDLFKSAPSSGPAVHYADMSHQTYVQIKNLHKSNNLTYKLYLQEY